MKIKKIVSLIIAVIVVLTPLLSVQSFASADETPVIDQSPKNLRWPQGALASYQCVCSNDKGHDKFLYEWHIVYNGKDYKFNGGMSDPWCAYIDKNNSGTVGNLIMFDGVQPGLDGAEIYCTVINGGTAVSSPRAVIMVGDPIMFLPAEIKAPTYVDCTQGEDVTISVSGRSTSGNVTEKKDFITYTWYRTDTGKLFDIQALFNGEDPVMGKTFKPDTSSAGTFYYVCGVFDGEENAPDMCNMSYTNIITVEVAEKIENIDIELLSAPSKTEYSVGETLDLTGLRVRILRSDGYLDLKDGNGVKVFNKVFDKAGEYTVTVKYEELQTEFKVNVRSKAPAAPKITKQPQGGEFKLGDECKLIVEAVAEGGCRLYYKWYKLTEDLKGDEEIFDAYNNDYIPPQTEGDAYYRCYVYAVSEDNETSEGIPTEVIKVTFTSGEAQTDEDSATGELTETETVKDVTEAPVGDITESAETSDTAETVTEKTEKNDNSGGGGENTAVVALIIVAVVMFLVLAAVVTLVIIIIIKKSGANK